MDLERCEEPTDGLQELRERCRRQERALRRAQLFAGRFEAMAERTNDCIAVLEALPDDPGRLRCTYTNRAARDAVGEPDWIEALVDRDLSEPIAEGRRNGGWSGEVTVAREDGTQVPLDLEVQVHLDGVALSYVALVARDLRERKKLEAKLLQAQKLEAVGQLAAGVAHEINTPMQYIGDNASFLKGAFDKLLRAVEQLAEIATSDASVEERRAAVERVHKKGKIDFVRKRAPRALDATVEGVASVSSIVAAMRAFGEGGASNRSLVSINEALEATVTVCRSEWKPVAVVDTHFGAGLDEVPAYPTELKQAFLNVLVNAAHAIGQARSDGGPGTIRIETAREGDEAVVRISDDGPGIPEEILDKIFDPFFTTRDVGQGRGQGLAVVHSIVVDQHGGSVEVNSTVGAGTEFVLRLPIGPLSLPAPSSAQGSSAAPS